MASLTIALAEIRTRAALVLNWDRTYGNWNAAQVADFDGIRRAGLAKFYNAHRWSFLRKRLNITFSAPYETGTIVVVAGVVTLSGGTFPASWAADGNLIVSGNRYYVASRDSGTQLTLTDTTAAYDAGTAYSLRHARYTLPADYSGLDGKLTYPNTSYDPIVAFRSEEELREAYMTYASNDGPRIYAIYPKTLDATVGQRWVLETWPEAGAAIHLVCRYNSMPDDLESTNIYPGGGIAHRETIMEAILSECELQLKKIENGPHTAHYRECLAMSVQHDKNTASPDSVGQLRDPYRSWYDGEELDQVFDHDPVLENGVPI